MVSAEQAKKVHDLFEARKYAKTPEEKAAITHAIDQAARGNESSGFAQPVKDSSGKVTGVVTAPGNYYATGSGSGVGGTYTPLEKDAASKQVVKNSSNSGDNTPGVDIKTEGKYKEATLSATSFYSYDSKTDIVTSPKQEPIPTYSMKYTPGGYRNKLRSDLDSIEETRQAKKELRETGESYVAFNPDKPVNIEGKEYPGQDVVYTVRKNGRDVTMSASEYDKYLENLGSDMIKQSESIDTNALNIQEQDIRSQINETYNWHPDTRVTFVPKGSTVSTTTIEKPRRITGLSKEAEKQLYGKTTTEIVKKDRFDISFPFAGAENYSGYKKQLDENPGLQAALGWGWGGLGNVDVAFYKLTGQGDKATQKQISQLAAYNQAKQTIASGDVGGFSASYWSGYLDSPATKIGMAYAGGTVFGKISSSGAVAGAAAASPRLATGGKIALVGIASTGVAYTGYDIHRSYESGDVGGAVGKTWLATAQFAAGFAGYQHGRTVKQTNIDSSGNKKMRIDIDQRTTGYSKPINKDSGLEEIYVTGETRIDGRFYKVSVRGVGKRLNDTISISKGTGIVQPKESSGVLTKQVTGHVFDIRGGTIKMIGNEAAEFDFSSSKMLFRNPTLNVNRMMEKGFTLTYKNVFTSEDDAARLFVLDRFYGSKPAKFDVSSYEHLGLYESNKTFGVYRDTGNVFSFKGYTESSVPFVKGNASKVSDLSGLNKLFSKTSPSVSTPTINASSPSASTIVSSRSSGVVKSFTGLGGLSASVYEQGATSVPSSLSSFAPAVGVSLSLPSASNVFSKAGQNSLYDNQYGVVSINRVGVPSLNRNVSGLINQPISSSISRSTSQFDLVSPVASSSILSDVFKVSSSQSAQAQKSALMEQSILKTISEGEASSISSIGSSGIGYFPWFNLKPLYGSGGKQPGFASWKKIKKYREKKTIDPFANMDIWGF